MVFFFVVFLCIDLHFNQSIPRVELKTAGELFSRVHSAAARRLVTVAGDVYRHLHYRLYRSLSVRTCASLSRRRFLYELVACPEFRVTSQQSRSLCKVRGCEESQIFLRRKTLKWVTAFSRLFYGTISIREKRVQSRSHHFSKIVEKNKSP